MADDDVSAFEYSSPLEIEQLYQALVKTSPEAVTITDLEGIITGVSERTLELHGYDAAAELIGKSAFELIAPEDRERAGANLLETLKSGVVRNLEYNLLTRDGSCFVGELSAALIKDSKGKPKAFIATTRDVTGIKRAEDAFKRVKSHLKTVLDGIDEAIVVISPDLRIVRYNRAFLRSLRKVRDGVLGGHCFKVIHDFKKPCRHCVVREMFRTGRPSRDIHYHLEPSGKVFHEVKAYPLRDSEGNVNQSIYVFSDVTERETMYERVREANLRLNELNRMKSDFISIASHELRTPLAIIKGYVDVIRAGVLGDCNPKQGEKLEAISDNISHLNAIISNMLDLSKIEAGELKLSRRKTRLNGLALRVVEDFKPIAAARGVRLRLSKSRADPRVLIDDGRMRQVLTNLLDNSIKFTSPGGTVTVGVGKRGGSVFLRVRDTGIGIEKKKLCRIFERFYQIDSSARRRFKGVGLGLPICKKIVELHGGEIKAESRINEGTLVTVKLKA